MTVLDVANLIRSGADFSAMNKDERAEYTAALGRFATAIEELRETAGWIDERVENLAKLPAATIRGTELSIEVAKMRGRGTLIRGVADNLVS